MRNSSPTGSENVNTHRFWYRARVSGLCWKSNTFDHRNGGKFQDPMSNTYYTYYTNASQNKYQILWFLENSDNPSLALINLPGVFTAYAGAYETLFPLTKGTNLGILIGTGTNLNQPAQELVTSSFTGIDMTKTTTSSGYTVVFSSTDSSSTASSGTWAYTGTLFTYVYNHRADLLTNKSLFGSDQGLVGYWDMETLTGTLLRDMSGNGHDGICYNSGTIVSTGSIVNCGTPGLGPKMESGANGGILTFDPDERNDNVLLGGTWTYYNFTILWKVNLSKVGTGDLNHSSLIGWPECNSWASVELLIGGETTEFDTDYQIGLGRCWQYSTDYFWNKTFKAGNWAYIGIVFERWKRITYFINGELFTSNFSYLLSKEDVFVKFPVIMPGRRKNYGSIDDVRIYNRALSDGEMQAVYTATK